MTSQERQKVEFQSRLKRISAGGPNTLGQVYVGVAEEAPSRKTKRAIRKSYGKSRISLKAILLYPFSIAGAFIIGMIAVVVARLARVYVYGGSMAGPQADLLMAVDAGAALAVAFVLRWIFRFQGKGLPTTSAIGVVLLLVSMHIFVHQFPEIFSLAFPAEWVAKTIATTDGNLLLVRGKSFPS